MFDKLQQVQMIKGLRGLALSREHEASYPGPEALEKHTAELQALSLYELRKLYDAAFPLRKEFTYAFPKADMTVDCVLFGLSPESRLELVLIRRGEEPFKGRWALPGGFVELLENEVTLEAARREMEEETGITVNYLEQLGTFDAPDRDPRGRVFSVAHYGLVRTQDHVTQHGSDAVTAEWVPAQLAVSLPAEEVAFDHLLIMKTALARLQAKIRYAPVGFNLLPKKFTLSELQRLYEAILFRSLDRGNFRKRLRILNEKTKILVEAGEAKAASGPPAKLYRFDKKAYDRAVKDGFNFEI